MRIDLSGRTALVTGSTAGIGFAIAAGLAAAGATVAVNGRTEKRVTEAIDQIRENQPDADLQPAVADVGTADGVATLVEAVPRVDVLVNNAGIFEPKPFGQIEDDDWQQVWDVNVMSGIRLARAYIDGMVEAGWGRIVFISSESALHIPAEMVHYGVTKTAQLAVARGMAESYPGTGVTINSVLPGPTRSEGVSQMLAAMAAGEDTSPEQVERDFLANERPTSLIQRLSTPDEVANMVVYVCSPQASATTGAALRVDGGVVRAIP